MSRTASNRELLIRTAAIIAGGLVAHDGDGWIQEHLARRAVSVARWIIDEVDGTGHEAVIASMAGVPKEGGR